MPIPSPTGPEFEEQTRVVARARWHLAAGEGGAETIAGHDIDVVCRTEDIVHLIMVTTERGLAKVSSDCHKLSAAKLAEEKKGNLAKCWMVTHLEPTKDQKAAGKDLHVKVMSLDQFRTSLVDAGLYLNARANYRFGSATDPDGGGTMLSEDEYVRLPLVADDGQVLTVAEIANGLLEGTAYVLSGPFGAGKSLTVREIFRELRTAYFKKERTLIPLAINLRDHWGQDDVSEVLTRHARNVGYPQPDQLVRAWNAGQMVALLDGFDELATRSWRVGPSAVVTARREALAFVRGFVRDRDPKVGLLIAGRSHYFDSASELRNALGLGMVKFSTVSVGEFTDEQAVKYLNRRYGSKVTLPDWLPRKPLLLGYLAANKMLDEVLAIPDGLGVAYAWDQFLDRVAAREAEITHDIDGSGVRRLLELLAARTRAVGTRGQLLESDLRFAYQKASGVEPSDDARVLLQRLPGLTARDDSEEGARTFVDIEMLDALRGSGTAHYLRSPYEDAVEGATWSEPLRRLGVSVASLLVERWGLALRQIAVAARLATERWSEPTLALDAVCAGGVVASLTGDALDMANLRISNGVADAIDLEGMTIRNLVLKECLLDEIVLSDTGTDSNLEISACLVGRVVGVIDDRWLPEWIHDCEVSEFDPAETNSAIMAMETVPMSVRVLLTVLRKLFVQRGAGRKESAFRRGLGPEGEAFVAPLLELLESERVASPSSRGGERVWQADRRHQGRILVILAEKDRSTDSLVTAARRL